jgi:hypothetical protein
MIQGEEKGLIFWPAERVRQAFREAEKAGGYKGEMADFRTFYLNMKYFLKTAEATKYYPDEEIIKTAEYEKLVLERSLAKIKDMEVFESTGVVQ